MRSILRWPVRAYRRGQALAEYSIIVAIVAIASIAVVTLFGQQIFAALFGSAEKIAGQEDVQVEDRTTGQDDAVERRLGNW